MLHTILAVLKGAVVVVGKAIALAGAAISKIGAVSGAVTMKITGSAVAATVTRKLVTAAVLSSVSAQIQGYANKIPVVGKPVGIAMNTLLASKVV